MSSKLFSWFLFGVFIALTNFNNITVSSTSVSPLQRIETINQIAKMVNLVETTRENPQHYNIIWFLISIYFAIASCFCLGCFAFIIKQYNDYKVYIKEVNYMHNRL